MPNACKGCGELVDGYGYCEGCRPETKNTKEGTGQSKTREPVQVVELSSDHKIFFLFAGLLKEMDNESVDSSKISMHHNRIGGGAISFMGDDGGAMRTLACKNCNSGFSLTIPRDVKKVGALIYYLRTQ